MRDQEDRLIRVEDKVDAIKDSIAAINVTLSSQHEILKEHIHRTELLEKEIKPISLHVAMVTGVVKAVMIVASIAAGIEGVFKLFHV